MKKKKILYIKAQGLGDMIGGLPFLVKMQQEGHEVYQTFYDMRYINKSIENLSTQLRDKFRSWPMYGGWHHILELFRKNNLIKDIIFIPYGYGNILKLCLKYFRYFDEVVIPIKTKPALMFGKIMGKKTRVAFDHTNDITQYKILANGEVEGKAPPLHTCYNNITRPTKEFAIESSLYITIYPSIFERSLDASVWKEIILYCKKNGLDVIVLGGDRESWFIPYIGDQFIANNTTNLIGKTNLDESAYILQHAKGTINGNGGIMRIANLVNKYSCNIHTVSAYLMQPPVDDIFSFNIRPYHYNKCVPCEAATSTIGDNKITPCVFCDTSEEGACRKAITFVEIKKFIDRVLLTK